MTNCNGEVYGYWKEAMKIRLDNYKINENHPVVPEIERIVKEVDTVVNMRYATDTVYFKSPEPLVDIPHRRVITFPPECRTINKDNVIYDVEGCEMCGHLFRGYKFKERK